MNGYVTALASSAALWLSACNGELVVLDSLEQQGSNSQSGSSSSPDNSSEAPPVDSSCGCASSPSLMALSCGRGEVPLLDNDAVQLTPDGSVVAFNVELPDAEAGGGARGLAYLVLRWDAGTSARPIANGLLVGLSADGDRVLISNGAAMLVDIDGFTSRLPVDVISGRGSLSAAGDSAIGATYPEGGPAQLARANVDTGEVQLLGEVAESIGRAYATPDGGTVVGFGESFEPTADNPLAEGSRTSFIWNSSGLTLGLPGVPKGTEVRPEAVSNDGMVVAGRSATTSQHFRWTRAGGYAEVSNASRRSQAFLSADGGVLLGSLDPDGFIDSAAFRWTESTGAVNLTPGRASIAVDVSADGNVIVADSWENAQSEGASPEDTFVWDAEHGTRTLDEVLSERGVDVSGWEFGHARALSDDGKVLLGRAQCAGVPTLYRIVLAD